MLILKCKVVGFLFLLCVCVCVCVCLELSCVKVEVAILGSPVPNTVVVLMVSVDVTQPCIELLWFHNCSGFEPSACAGGAVF